MDKQHIINSFKDDDKILALNLYEKYKLSYNKNICMFGNDFYPPNIWRYFKDNFNSGDCSVEDDGYFENAERRMICFNNKLNESFPFEVLKIENASKYNTLKHSDYLGSILSLGIKRCKIGDLLVKDNVCYLTVCSEIKEYLLDNIKNIGRTPCKVTVFSKEMSPPSYKFEELIVLVPSLRVDSIVTKLIKNSRTKAQNYIENGKVLVNYNEVRDKSKELIENDRITLRGYGKFIIGEIIGNSKSGKLKVVIKKYL